MKILANPNTFFLYSPFLPSLLSFRLYTIFSFSYCDRLLTGLSTYILLRPHLISPYHFRKLCHVTPVPHPFGAPPGCQEKVLSLCKI